MTERAENLTPYQQEEDPQVAQKSKDIRDFLNRVLGSEMNHPVFEQFDVSADNDKDGGHRLTVRREVGKLGGTIYVRTSPFFITANNQKIGLELSYRFGENKRTTLIICHLDHLGKEKKHTDDENEERAPLVRVPSLIQLESLEHDLKLGKIVPKERHHVNPYARRD